MGVKGDGGFYPTDSIVSKRVRKHYRVPVRSQHWQLRSLISAEKRHIIYFPGGSGSNHVQRLNTATYECETIKLLTFAPRCLVAGNGWLCCGSENGEFVAIRLSGDGEMGSPSSGLELDAETRQHLGFDASRDDSLLSLLAQARRSNKSLIAKSMKLLKDRVNCITLWFPPTELPAADEAYSEPVAVLANNDCSVILASLRDFDQKDKSDPLDTVQYPDYVNRAIISPDGRLLIAILDDPYLYVHERVEKTLESPSPSQSGNGREYQWELRQRLLLKSQRKDDKSDSRGSFAACFSASGSYLAVGTQHGTISIFNATLLSDPDEEPLITTFTSSRPQSGPGAIRDMAFCPGPFDILAWTEDRGHIGIADVRTNFVVRQIVDINAESEFEHISVFDRNTIDPRLLDGQSSRRDNSLSSPLDHNAAGPSRREVDGLDTLNTPLTASETMVLEAIQGDRRRRERGVGTGVGTQTRTGTQRAPGEAGDLTWAYMSNSRLSGNTPTSNGDSQRPSQRSSSVGRAMGDLLGSHREQRERAQERVRTARQLMRDAGERQQQQVQAATQQQQIQQQQILRRSDQRWMDRLGETVAAMRDRQDGQGSPSYLNVLEILQGRDRPTNDAEGDESSAPVPLVNQVVSRWEESAIRGTLASDHGVFEVPPSPDNTAGLSWSEDGRTLFVGAQNGIYELHINVQSRKFCPGIKLR